MSFESAMTTPSERLMTGERIGAMSIDPMTIATSFIRRPKLAIKIESKIIKKKSSRGVLSLIRRSIARDLSSSVRLVKRVVAIKFFLSISDFSNWWYTCAV